MQSYMGYTHPKGLGAECEFSFFFYIILMMTLFAILIGKVIGLPVMTSIAQSAFIQRPIELVCGLFRY